MNSEQAPGYSNHENQTQQHTLTLEKYITLQAQIARLSELSRDQAIPGLDEYLELLKIEITPDRPYYGEILSACRKLISLIVQNSNGGYNVIASLEIVHNIEKIFKDSLENTHQSIFLFRNRQDRLEATKSNIVKKMTQIKAQAEKMSQSLESLKINQAEISEILTGDYSTQTRFWNKHINTFMKNLNFLESICDRILNNLLHNIDDGIITEKYLENYDKTVDIYSSNWEIIHTNFTIFTSFPEITGDTGQMIKYNDLKNYIESNKSQYINSALDSSKKILDTLVNFSD